MTEIKSSRKNITLSRFQEKDGRRYQWDAEPPAGLTAVTTVTDCPPSLCDCQMLYRFVLNNYIINIFIINHQLKNLYALFEHFSDTQ